MKKGIVKCSIILFALLAGCGNAKDAVTSDNMGKEAGGNTPKVSMDASGLFQEVESSVLQSQSVLSLENGISYNALCENLKNNNFKKNIEPNVLNRKLSFSPEDNQKSLFCLDEMSGAVYFVNQNQDWFIYRLLEDEVELAVAFPAKELYMWEGKLYFMAKDYGVYDLQEINNGDILAYTPEKGSVELIYAAGEGLDFGGNEVLADGLQKMTVSENGIHFIGDIAIKTVDWEGLLLQTSEQTAYTLPFEKSEPVIDNRNQTNLGWGNFIFSTKTENNGTELVMLSRENSEDMVELSLSVPSSFAVLGDNLYCLYKQNILVCNLVTKEQKTYDFYEIMNKTCEEDIGRIKEYYIKNNEGDIDIDDVEIKIAFPELVAFTKTDNTLWAIDGYGRIYSMDMETGNAAAFQIGSNLPVTNQEMLELINYDVKLYTDGTNLYMSDGSGVFKILVKDTMESTERSIHILEKLSLVK